MKKVLGIGNALVDVMTRLEDEEIIRSLGFPKGSMQLVDLQQSDIIKALTGKYVDSLTPGGSAANTIHGLAMLGVETGYIGSVGKDSMGEVFENEMKAAGVNTYMMYRTTPTGTAVAMITPDSERTFGTHLGAAIELVKGDIKKEWFRGYDFLYLEGYLINNIDLVREVCKRAKEARLKIVIDLSSFNVVEAYLDSFREIIGDYVDIIFANEEEAKAFTGKEPLAALDELASGCEIAVVKIGSEGSLIQRDGEVIKVGTSKVRTIDTTGAGDLYSAGFLFGLVRGETLDKCGEYGTLLAGKVIEVFGPKMTSEQWSEISNEILHINGDQ